MPKGFDDLKYPLVATCEITNFGLQYPIKSRAAQVIPEALFQRVVYICGLQELLIVY